MGWNIHMKIAILTPTFNNYSGVDRVAQDRAEKLVKEGHDVTVIAFEAKIKPTGYKVIDLGIPDEYSSYLSRFYHRFLPFFITKEKYIKMLKGYDKVISFLYPMDALAYQAKKRYKTRYIAWFSGIAPGENFFAKIYMGFYKMLYYKFLNEADEIICVSNFVKNKLLKENPKIQINKIDVKYNEIDKTRFSKNVNIKYKNKINEIKEKYNLKNKKVFVYVGRLATSKRVDLLIKMFKMEKKEHPEYKLLIVGKKTFRDYWEKLLSMAADEDIIFTGEVDNKDLPAYYAVSDVYVTASSDEGFNLPAVEAQACGKPVVAFDVGAHKEVIKKGKGILVPEGDIKGFISAMNSYANSISSKRQFI